MESKFEYCPKVNKVKILIFFYVTGFTIKHLIMFN